MTDFRHYWGIGKLKQLLRQGWINNVPISGIESVADHSFAVAYFSYIFSLWENDLRRKKDLPFLKKDPRDYCIIGLMHDIAESYYLDFDKNTLQLVPEIKSIKKLAEKRGFQKVNEFWSEKSLEISNKLEEQFPENLDNESKSFIELIDKIELHWQTITYFKQNWISLDHAEPFITSTSNFILNFKNDYLFIEEMIKEGLIIKSLKN